MDKRELSQLYYLKKEIENQRQRLAKLESAADYQPQQLSFMPHGNGTSDKTGRYGTEIAELKQLIALNIQKCEIEKNRIERFIQSVDDSYIRELLRLRFIDCKSWQAVAMAMGGYNTADNVKKRVYRFLDKDAKPM